MNGIKMSDCKFYVDEENRTVICVIPKIVNDNLSTANALVSFISENCEFSDISFWDALNYKSVKELSLPESFRGKAVCAPDDEWDVETGKLIAFSRAKEKFYKSFFKRANIFVRMIDKRLEQTINAFNDFGMQVQVNSDTLQAQIDDKLGTEEEEE